MAAIKNVVVVGATLSSTSPKPLLIDAAISANVKRLIPSEFGVDPRLVAGTKLEPLLAGKIKVVEYLKDKAQQHTDFSWTALVTGSLFEFGLLRGGFGFDVSRKHVTIFDSGDTCFSPTSFNLVGKGVAAILSQLEETKNRYLAVSSFTTSQNQLLKILEEETGEEWAQGHVSTNALEKIGLEKLSQNNPLGVLDLMKAFQFQDGQDRALSEQSNDDRALGLPSEDVLTLVRSLILI